MSDNKVLAKVNDEEIKDNELDFVLELYPEEQRFYFESEKGRKALLEQKIAFNLMSKFAKEKELDKDEAFLNKKKALEEQLLAQTAINDLFSNIQISDEELKEVYENNKNSFTEDEQVSAKHILMSDENELKKVREDILNGVISFEDAAVKYSTCPSKDRGGDLGFFKRGMMVKEFEDVAFDMDINDISDLVKTQFGYHILKLEDKKEKRELGFDEVKLNLKAQMMKQKQDSVYAQKLQELRNIYKVEIFE